MPLEPKGITIIDNDAAAESKLDDIESKIINHEETLAEVETKVSSLDEAMGFIDEDLSKAESSIEEFEEKFLKLDKRMAEIEERYVNLNHNFTTFRSETYDNLKTLFEERRKKIAIRDFFKTAFVYTSVFSILCFAVYGVIQLIRNLN